jgi:hypothetical protein
MTNSTTPSSTALVAYGTPTPERLRKDGDWERKMEPGGQVSHQARSAIATYAKHFTEDEIGMAASSRMLIWQHGLT